MTENEIRLRCLEIAAERDEWLNSNDLLAEAQKYYHFTVGWLTVGRPDYAYDQNGKEMPDPKKD